MTTHVLKDERHPLWDQAWALYCESFDECELRSLALHGAVMKDEQFICNAYTDGEVFVGILFYWIAPEFAFVEHFAVNPELRGKNYGSRILSAFLAENKNVLLEIEVPSDELKLRRQRFYERLGFYKNEYLHVHLPYHSHLPPHELNVMSLAPLSMEEYKAFYDYWENRIMQGAN